MDLSIAAILAQDGITSGAIYALLALALVLVFSVTRVIFIPQGEFVAYGALTLAAMQAGHAPQTTWLLLAMGVLTFLYECVTVLRSAELRRTAPRRLAVLAGKYVRVSAGRSPGRCSSAAGSRCRCSLQIAPDAADRDSARADAVPGGVPAAGRSQRRWCC